MTVSVPASLSLSLYVLWYHSSPTWTVSLTSGILFWCYSLFTPIYICSFVYFFPAVRCLFSWYRQIYSHTSPIITNQCSSLTIWSNLLAFSPWHSGYGARWKFKFVYLIFDQSVFLLVFKEHFIRSGIVLNNSLSFCLFFSLFLFVSIYPCFATCVFDPSKRVCKLSESSQPPRRLGPLVTYIDVVWTDEI